MKRTILLTVLIIASLFSANSQETDASKTMTDASKTMTDASKTMTDAFVNYLYDNTNYIGKLVDIAEFRLTDSISSVYAIQAIDKVIEINEINSDIINKNYMASLVKYRQYFSEKELLILKYTIVARINRNGHDELIPYFIMYDAINDKAYVNYNGVTNDVYPKLYSNFIHLVDRIIEQMQDYTK